MIVICNPPLVAEEELFEGDQSERRILIHHFFLNLRKYIVRIKAKTAAASKSPEQKVSQNTVNSSTE